jgi:hypothetical protein
MTPDPELISETRTWFIKAAHDIRMAELALRDDPAMTDQAVYHSQQAAEKVMKGFLTWHERIFRKTHNLVGLARPALDFYRKLSRFSVVPPAFQIMPGNIVTPVIWMNPIQKRPKMP